MSHLVEIKTAITDLDVLAEACRYLGGVELVKGPGAFRWYGSDHTMPRSDLGHQLPTGFTSADLGVADAAVIRVTGDRETPRSMYWNGQEYPQNKARPYEIGVSRRRDGQPGFTLLWDPYGGGFGLEQAIGAGAKTLLQRYQTITQQRTALRRGYRVSEVPQPDGSVKLVAIR